MMNVDKLNNNPTVKYIYEEVLDEKIPWPESLTLVGGAVVDILEGRKPKDFDFICNSENIIYRFKAKGFLFMHETKTATTYSDGTITVQFLKTSVSDFEYKISQASYSFESKNLTLCRTSFKYKTLIPVTFESRKAAIECLRRIPHWKNKGYSIPDMTYLSLLNVALKQNNFNKLNNS